MSKHRVLTLLRQRLERDEYEVTTYFSGSTIQAVRPVSTEVLEVVLAHSVNADGHHGTLVACGVHLAKVERLFLEETLKKIPLDSWMRSTPLPLRPSLQDEHWIEASEAGTSDVTLLKIDDILSMFQSLAMRLTSPAAIREELQSRRSQNDPELLLWLSAYERAFVS